MVQSAHTTMPTRCHPAPPRRTACPRLREDRRAARSGRGWLRRIALLAIAVTLASASRVSASERDRTVDEALALCAAADRLPVDERLPVLARGLELAEAAVALDARSA